MRILFNHVIWFCFAVVGSNSPRLCCVQRQCWYCEAAVGERGGCRRIRRGRCNLDPPHYLSLSISLSLSLYLSFLNVFVNFWLSLSISRLSFFLYPSLIQWYGTIFYSELEFLGPDARCSEGTQRSCTAAFGCRSPPWGLWSGERVSRQVSRAIISQYLKSILLCAYS